MDNSVSEPQEHFLQGIAAYQRGDHQGAQACWQSVWQQEQDEQRQRFLQALIQIATAAHMACKNITPRTALRLLSGATERLEVIEDIYMGIDIRALREGILHSAEELERELQTSDGDHGSLKPSLAPPLSVCGTTPLWSQAQTAPAVPELARQRWFTQGVRAYHRGDFFDAHEYWEEIWRDEEDEDERQFLQGLIQVAAAMHKVIEHKKPAPAARLLERALLRLTSYPSPFRGVHMTKLVASCELTRRALLTMSNESACPFPEALVPALEVDGLKAEELDN